MDVILIGGFIEIIELCENCNINIVGIIDNIVSETLYGYPILGNDSSAHLLLKKYCNLPLIISPDSPILRKKLVDYYTSLGFSFENLISPKAEISKSAQIEKGVIIQSGVNISSNVTINKFVKINTQANIMHDTNIGAFTTIAPNAVILGHVQIAEQCYIGANSTILPKIIIKENVIVGAGAVVVKNTESGLTIKGIPAK